MPDAFPIFIGGKGIQIHHPCQVKTCARCHFHLYCWKVNPNPSSRSSKILCSSHFHPYWWKKHIQMYHSGQLKTWVGFNFGGQRIQIHHSGQVKTCLRSLFHPSWPKKAQNQLHRLSWGVISIFLWGKENQNSSSWSSKTRARCHPILVGLDNTFQRCSSISEDFLFYFAFLSINLPI